ncbi:MAG TPA: arginine--tRNA ligase [Candidatus Binataceae bacterium]|nr:arginine--tRNA ligase [Candidatus Binataceae bacterium]
MKDLILPIITAAIEKAHTAGKLKSSPSNVTVGTEAPKDPSHGDIASNVALTLARAEGKAPRAIAEVIREHIELPDEVKEVAVAGPGFINFRMAARYWHREMRRAVAEGRNYFRPRKWQLRDGGSDSIQVEFLSANPTGPLTVGHGRNAVLGDTIARLYEAAGFKVSREYYFNDGGRQMRLLGESVQVRYLQALGREAVLPKDGYQGEYIKEIAAALKNEHGDQLADLEDREIFRAAAVKAIFAEILATCKTLLIHFDTFKNELDLVRDGRVERVISGLEQRGLVVKHDGALWLKAEPLGLPKDRVIVRSGDDADPIYRTPDIAYHIEKIERGFDLIVDVFGADHIAEHEDVIAAVKALGHDTSRIKAIIYQFVTLTRAGEKVKMSTRKATYVTLDELIEEVGVDVVRFFFLFRKHNSQLDFDLELAKKQAPENPVFYVQYAHARLASVFREAEKAGLTLPDDTSQIDLTLLSDEELDLAKRVLDYPEIATGAAQALEPHRIPFYLLELAGEFHRYYNKPANRIIGPERELSLSRLYLANLMKTGIGLGLELLGVAAPDRM